MIFQTLTTNLGLDLTASCIRATEKVEILTKAQVEAQQKVEKETAPVSTDFTSGIVSKASLKTTFTLFKDIEDKDGAKKGIEITGRTEDDLKKVKIVKIGEKIFSMSSLPCKNYILMDDKVIFIDLTKFKTKLGEKKVEAKGKESEYYGTCFAINDELCNLSSPKNPIDSTLFTADELKGFKVEKITSNVATLNGGSSKKKIIIVVSLLLVVLAAAGGAIYYFNFYKNGEAIEEEEEKELDQ